MEKCKHKYNIMYFKGYKIVGRTSVNTEELELLIACESYVQNKSTIRATAKKYGYSTTTLWWKMHNICNVLSPDLYDDVCWRMEVNKSKARHRKGEENE